MVHSVQKTLREFRHGPDREEMGGTNLESQCASSDLKEPTFNLRDATETGSNTKKFLEHYLEEIKVQLRGGRTPKS